MHLAVLAGGAAVGVEHHRGVVVQAGGALLEQRADQYHAVLPGQFAEALGRGAGDGFGEVEFVHRFVLAEVRAIVQFLQQDELRAGLGGFGHALFDDGEVRRGIAVVPFLHKGNG